ncbi:MAG: antitoxin component YwqK of YwqJK toxin-antitoxin module/peroxiredoxin [Planctomycetota bacterium]|jgi:antitoxin component YwqK of YwqJK toxin-antitoxin module/peroxiredoxin
MSADKLRHVTPLGALVTAVALSSLSGCALLDPTAYGFVYGPGIRSAEGQVSAEGGLQQGRWRYKADGGQVISEGEFVDDVRTGPWADYYENGNPKYLYTLKDSSRHGLFQSWHPSGKLATAGQFVQGYQFGSWTFHDTAGRLSETGAFLNDHREGRWTKWHKDGSPKLTELHFEGQRVGHWQHFDENGELTDIWNSMPEGLEWCSESWPDGGALRREGFLLDGKPVGLWKTFHDDGLLRAVGAFENGEPAGPWHLYCGDGELIARGEFAGGRPRGEWTVTQGGSSSVVDAMTFQGGMPMMGEWSPKTLDDSESTGVVVNTWVEEARSPVDPSAMVSQAAPLDIEPESAEQLSAALEVAAVEPEVPVPTTTFTEKEQTAYAKLVEYYGGEQGALNELQSIYRGSRSSKKAATTGFPEEGGDTARAARFIGKPLPMTKMYAPDGTLYDIDQLKGGNVVLVLLRGFDGEVCPYCVAQTESLCKAGALSKFDDRDAKLVVVFPGSSVSLETFQESYEMLGKKQRDAYHMRYANAHDVAEQFDLVGEKVMPSTLILDYTGTVRFAYVGKNVQDRPTLPLLIKELDRIEAE